MTHLRHLWDFKLPARMLRNFYTCTFESIPSGRITSWMGNCTKLDFLALRPLPNLQDIYKEQCRSRALKIINDPTYSSNRLFSQLPSGRRFC